VEAKRTDLIAAQLEVISNTLQSNYCRKVLKDAAVRLRDLEIIAKIYYIEATKLAQKKRGKSSIFKRKV
jgi:hypothetical protein